MIEICFEHVFIDTTDPNTPYSRLLQLDVLSSTCVSHYFVFSRVICLWFRIQYQIFKSSVH